MGLTTLTITVLLMRDQPWVKQGVLALIAFQAFWYLLRVLLMIGIWKREPELSAGDKIWLGITAPIYVLGAIWWYHGKLSDWIAGAETKEQADD